MNALDVLAITISSGPTAPSFAQPVRGAPTIEGNFGDPGSIAFSTELRLSGAGEVRAPHNVVVRRVPALPSPPDVQAALAPVIDGLREATGARLDPSTLEEGDLFLTVWPGAFRALEALFAAVEIPLPESAGGGLPGFPVPRTWWIRGLGSASVTAALTAEVARQFEGSSPPDLTAFQEGRGEIYVPADTVLGSAAAGSLRLRCWDCAGLPVDPSAVLGTFIGLAGDVGAIFARPDATVAAQWAGPRRLVFAFSDAQGAPYAPWTDPPPPTDGGLSAPSTTPNRQVRFESLGEDIALPDTGLLIIPAADPRYALLVAGITDLVMDGEHVVSGAWPHGRLSDQPSFSVQDYAFLRVRVLDYAEWFPHHPNPRSDFARYTTGNTLIPLADALPAYRAIYRSIRATHRVESYTGPTDLPDGQALTAQPSPPYQALLINAWYSPDTALLGRRAMTRAPRTQPGAMQAEGDAPQDGLFPADPGALVGRFQWIAGASFPNDIPNPEPADPGPTDPASIGRTWYWVTAPGKLPPGGWLRLQLLDTLDHQVAPDPNDPAAMGTIDAFGQIAVTGSPSGFVGPGGQACVPVRYDPDIVAPGAGNPRLRAELLAVTWEPEEGDADPTGLASTGKGSPQPRGYGVVELELPVADPLSPPPFAHPAVNLIVGAHLERTAAAGKARLVLPAGLVIGPCVVVVVNPRCGDVFWRQLDQAPAGAVLVELDGIALEDEVLVGFRGRAADTGEAFAAETDGGVTPDLTRVTHLFPLSFPTEAHLAGAAPAHPRESLGMLREAVDGGADVRLLAWRDDTAAIKAQLGRSLGGVVGVNATWAGKRGQAILDGITRETGSHHQKPAFVYGPEGPVAFVGGIDQANGRYGPRGHAGVDPDRPGGLWHDIHCKVRGRAALDVYRNFRDRWNAWLAHPEIANPVAGGGFDPADAGLLPLPTMPPAYEAQAAVDGPHTVQINRTIARSIEQFAAFLDPELGDLSIEASYERVFARARTFLYFEEQYWWNVAFARDINQRLQTGELAFVMVLLPRFLAETAYVDLLLYAIRRRALSMLLYGTEEMPAPGAEGAAAGNVASRVAIFHIQNDLHEPVYVHCKTIIADDLWMSIGSSNLNRRSMSYDSEIAAAVVDTRVRRGAHRTVRAFRVDLLAEHLRLQPWETPLIEDPMDAFRLVKAVLAGEDTRPTNLVPANLRETHYGIQPAAMDGDFHEALRIAFDPDGSQLHISGRLLTLAALLHEASDSEADPNFSGFGSLRVTLTFPDPASGAGLLAQFTVNREAPGAALVHLGPFAADTPALLGLIVTGGSYTISVTVVDPAAPEVPRFQGATGPFDTPGFANSVTVAVAPV